MESLTKRDVGSLTFLDSMMNFVEQKDWKEDAPVITYYNFNSSFHGSNLQIWIYNHI
jgi:hypothetical protein